MNTSYQPEYSYDGLTLEHMPEEFEGEFIIPEGVMEVADLAFFSCTNLTAVKFPTTLKRIGDCAFKFCDRLKSIDIPDTVTEIGEQAFYDCRSLTDVKLPSNLSEIKSETFSHTAIVELEIPNSVKLIEDHAFYDCYRLYDVRLPNDAFADGRVAGSRPDALGFGGGLSEKPPGPCKMPEKAVCWRG